MANLSLLANTGNKLKKKNLPGALLYKIVMTIKMYVLCYVIIAI